MCVSFIYISESGLSYKYLLDFPSHLLSDLFEDSIKGNGFEPFARCNTATTCWKRKTVCGFVRMWELLLEGSKRKCAISSQRVHEFYFTAAFFGTFIFMYLDLFIFVQQMPQMFLSDKHHISFMFGWSSVQIFTSALFCPKIPSM